MKDDALSFSVFVDNHRDPSRTRGVLTQSSRSKLTSGSIEPRRLTATESPKIGTGSPKIGTESPKIGTESPKIDAESPKIGTESFRSTPPQPVTTPQPSPTIGILPRRTCVWIDDQSVDDCYHCHKQFTWRLRRHHCRGCGRIFCYECSRYIIHAYWLQASIALG